MYKKELDSGTLLFVEVPMEATSILHHKNTIDYLIATYRDRIKLPNGNWQLLGLSTELTEGQLKDVMPYVLTFEGKVYLDFMPKDFNAVYHFDTATEAFQSLKSDLGLTDENKYGKKPIRHIPFMSDGFYSQWELEQIEDYNNHLKDWQSEQSKVKKLIVLFNPKK